MEKFIREFQRQAAILHQLPLRKKPGHIWRYYRFHLIVAVSVIAVIVSSISLIINGQKETIISGMFLNNSVSDEGYDYLSDGYWRFCGADKGKKAELVTNRFIEFDAEVMGQDQLANITMLSVMISERGLDYIITDEASLYALEAMGVVMDLAGLLPQERLAELETVTGETGILGIRLDHTGFAAQFPLLRDGCVMVPSTAPSAERVLDFLEYLLKE